MLSSVFSCSYSEGGFSAVAAADGFEKHGITPVKVMSGSAPLKERSATIFGVLSNISTGQDPSAGLFFALGQLPLSDTR